MLIRNLTPYYYLKTGKMPISFSKTDDSNDKIANQLKIQDCLDSYYRERNTCLDYFESLPLAEPNDKGKFKSLMSDLRRYTTMPESPNLEYLDCEKMAEKVPNPYRHIESYEGLSSDGELMFMRNITGEEVKLRDLKTGQNV